MNNSTIATPSRIVQLAAELAPAEPIRRGSLYERRIKCGQPACPCHRDPKAAHGPYFTLTQKVEGKTRSRYVASPQVAIVQRQIQAGRQFQARVEAYWEASQRWADEQLEPATVATEAAEKKGSKRRFTTRLSKRSKRS